MGERSVCPTFAEYGKHDTSCYVSVCAYHVTDLEAAERENEKLREALSYTASLLDVLGSWFIEAQPDVPMTLQDAVVASMEQLAGLEHGDGL